MFGLGWVGKFGSVGAVGSANGPAAQGDIVQWLQGGTTDGLTLIDKKETLTEPEIVDVSCLSFDGVNDYVTVGDLSELDFLTSGSDFTIGGWVSCDALTAQFQGFFGKRDSHGAFTIDGYHGHFGRTTFNPNTFMAYVVQDGVTYAIKQSFTPQVDVLRLVLVRFEAQTSTLNISIDGAPFASGSSAGGLALSVDDNFNYADGGTPTYDTLGGTVASMFAAGRALTDEEALAWYNGTPPTNSIFHHTLEESLGTTAYDISGNGNHGTITGATWTTADGIPSWNHLNGFRAAVADTPPFIPALADGSGNDALGNPLTNPAGYTHNRSECGVLQTDSFFNAGTVNFFSADGATIDKKSIADFDAHYLVNGHYNLWLKFDEDGFVELDKSVQYPLDKVFTVAEATRNLRYFGSGSVPEYDVDGNIVLDVNGFISYPA